LEVERIFRGKRYSFLDLRFFEKKDRKRKKNMEFVRREKVRNYLKEIQ